MCLQVGFGVQRFQRLIQKVRLPNSRPFSLILMIFYQEIVRNVKRLLPSFICSGEWEKWLKLQLLVHFCVLKTQNLLQVKNSWTQNPRYFTKFLKYLYLLAATDLKVDGGYGAMSAEGLGESSAFAGTDY